MPRQRLQPLDIAETAREFAAAAAADAVEILQRGAFEGHMAPAGIHHQVVRRRQEEQMNQLFLTAAGALLGDLDDLVAFAARQFRKILQREDQHAPLVCDGHHLLHGGVGHRQRRQGR